MDTELPENSLTSKEVIASLGAGLVLIWVLVLYQGWNKWRLLRLPTSEVEEVTRFEEVLDETESGVAAVAWTTYLAAPLGIVVILLSRGHAIAEYSLSGLAAVLTLAILGTGLLALFLVNRLRYRWSRDSMRFARR